MLPGRYILQSCLYQRNLKIFSSYVLRNFSSRNEDPEANWDRIYQRGVPRTREEMLSVMTEEVDSPPDSKLLKVAIIGVPNSGKSTLINRLMRWRVCSVSSKVHTTQVNCRAVLNHSATQIVFLDTPGLVTPEEVSKHKLDPSHLSEADLSLHSADLMAVMHDMSSRHTYRELHPRVLRLLALHPKTPSILILNKLDIFKSKGRLLDATIRLTEGIVGGEQAFTTVEKSKLNKKSLIKCALKNEASQATKNYVLDKEEVIERTLQNEQLKTIENEQIENIENKVDSDHIDEGSVFDGRVQLTEDQVSEFIKNRKGWPRFQDVFMISALDGSGVDSLRDYLISKAYSSSWLFSSKFVTDQNPEEIALLTVREKFLDYFKKEIPYMVKFEIEFWDFDSDILYIGIQVGCRRKGLVAFVVGAEGLRINEITRKAQEELQRTFRTPVCLKLNVVYDTSLKKL